MRVLNMSSWKVYLTCILSVTQMCLIQGQKLTKSSLTFVIDDTYSMYNEIDQVKRSVNSIFDTVAASKDSQIENFILVTFNDPDAHLLVITKDRDEFKRALASITVHGGGDCPEYAMSGIKIALEHSLPLSILYVFTDASSHEAGKYDELLSISQKKQIQVTYLLTGQCSVGDGNDKVYYDLAKATSGEVFNIMKTDIEDVLNYVKENIKGRRNELASASFPPGYGHEMTYKVDSKTDDVIISVSGISPKIEVIAPDGKKIDTKDVLRKAEAVIVKVPKTDTHENKLKVGSMSTTHVKVTGKTTVNFQLGFSVFEPTSLSDTATRPPPDGNAYLSIQLYGKGVKLVTAKILDMSNNVIATLPLRLIDDKNKFYVTELFNPPMTMFQVSVSGYDEEDSSLIERTAPTPIQRQNPEHVSTVNVAPTVTIEGQPKIVKDYNSSLLLKCKVHGYPKPEITWKEKSSGEILPVTVLTIETPYDYMGILDIENSNKNNTYECKASNPLGETIQYIEVQTKVYFKILETPKNIMKIEYDKEGQIICKVDASPTATITWLKDGRLLLNDTNVEISSDMTSVTIKHMKLDSQGVYICEARNELERKLFTSNVAVIGLVKPKIDKKADEIYIFKGKDAELTCRITQGTPPPTIKWYYQRYYNETLQKIEETGEILHLKHVTLDHVGSYLCVASNVVGSERYVMDLSVQYPPTIKNDYVKTIWAKDGDAVMVSCDVDGVPGPKVKWYKNKIKLESEKNIRIATNFSLKFQKIMVSDAGSYTCEAENEFGSTNKTVSVYVYVPPEIEIPEISTIETMVGRNLLLPCRADGYPKPEIKWIYNDLNGERPPKRIRSNKKSMVLDLKKMQLRDKGYYTCVATNIGGSSNITYKVIVNAPPIIENIYRDKTFKSVNGDLVLRIQCRATGSPEPTILWKKDDLNIAMGSDWYDIENGTLIIKNIDKKSAGTYLCLAQNKIGNDTMVYNVIVDDYPISNSKIPTKYIEDGKFAHITCDIPHKITDLLRWYKDHKLIQEGELTINRVTSSDAGTYSCRVSDYTKSRSAHVNVDVGYKPYFITNETELIVFAENDIVPLGCEAEGNPEPKISWKYNDETIYVTDMTYDLQMKLDNRGIYSCDVSNDLGSIHRSFKIVSKDCILDTRKDFLNNSQPIMLTPSLTWPTFNVINGYMNIPNSEPFILHCPKGFTLYPTLIYLEAFCEGDTKILINGNVFKYTDIKCIEDVKPITRQLGRKCLPGNTEFVQVGYIVMHKFFKVYDVCLDKDNNVPLFTEHELSSAQYYTSRSSDKWFPEDLLPLDFDTMYDCKTQAADISSTLGTAFHPYDDCCFNKRQLVNPTDLRPGIPTETAFTYLNVVPHWSTCNSKNWAEIEDRVRNLAKLYKNDVTIVTGTANPRRAVSRTHHKDIKIHDERGRTQPIAKYLWKVVQDPESSSSIAIIQVNVPDLSPTDASSYVLCRDICNEIEWLKNANWHNVADGYTYCCEILDFESAFDYRGQFSRNKTAILNYAPLTRKYYYSI